jgi:hypothetical protein
MAEFKIEKLKKIASVRHIGKWRLSKMATKKKVWRHAV